MSETLKEFERIVEKLSKQEGVILGKMMSSPGLKYNNKVFAFYYKDQMCFKLGESKTPDELGISYEFLNPFKTKPPLKGWFVVGAEFIHQWQLLADEALERMKNS